jgi:hypothetical protein
MLVCCQGLTHLRQGLTHLRQGLTPLAINCRPSGAKGATGNTFGERGASAH